MVGGEDGTVRIRDPRTGGLVTTLAGTGNDVQSMAFSPDGALVVTGGADGTISVSEASTGESLITLHAPAGIDRVAFADGGQLVVAALRNGAVVRYGCDVCGSAQTLLSRARARTTRPLSADERTRYLHRS